jgi:hypothetical protein
MLQELPMGSALALALVVFGAADMPLVGRVVPGSNPQVELRNAGDRAVTAWSFAVVSPTATGTHREVHSADVYLSDVTRGLPQATAHLDWLRPGQSRTIPVDAAPAGASVEIVAVVLEDGTALGDADSIATFFAQRSAERDELKKVVDTINASIQTKHGMAALEDLQRRFADGAGANESTPHRSAREAVAAWQQKARTASQEGVDRSIRTYVEFVTKQYEAAAKHAQRKG